MGIANKTVKIRWNGNNRKHYENLGYTYSYNKIFEVPVEHLSKGTHVLLTISCDYCGETKELDYKTYLQVLSANEIKKYCCKKCHPKKKKELLEYKNNNNLLTKNDDGYWTFKENRMKELDLFIKTNKIIEDTNDKIFDKIYNSLARNGEYLWESVLELGYNPSEVIHCRKVGIYDNYENIEKEIKLFIDKYNRFPMQEDFIYELKISDFQLAKYGGIYELKRRMCYIDDKDLVDKNGYYNASLGEYLIAEFLIKNNIEYNRNVIIDKDSGKYNCDFVLHLKNNDLVWVEYWGGLKNNDTIFLDYKETHKIKMDIYRKTKKKLISIYPIIFENTNDIIQYELENIFRPYKELS